MDHLVTIRRATTTGDYYDALQNAIEAWLHEQEIAYSKGRAPEGHCITYALRRDHEMEIYYRFANLVDAAAFKMRWG